MRCVLKAAIVLTLSLPSSGVSRAADTLAVDVVNASEPTLCAEKDNVELKLTSGDVRRFTVEAMHPAYTGTIVVDRSAFDLHNCPDLAAAPFINADSCAEMASPKPAPPYLRVEEPSPWRKGSKMACRSF